MKAAILVLFLLVHTVDSYSDTRAKAIQFFDSARSLIAKNAQIANMNELENHEELENILYVQLGEIGGCSVPRIIYDDSDAEILVEYHLNVNTETMDKQLFSKLFGGAAKQMMGYVETKCMETGKDVHSYVFYKTNEQELHGPPGNKCPSGRKATSDGLCALENSYTERNQQTDL